MKAFEIMIVKEGYPVKHDEKKDIDTHDIVYGPKLEWAYNQKGAIGKAIIRSKVSADELDGLIILAREFPRVY